VTGRLPYYEVHRTDCGDSEVSRALRLFIFVTITGDVTLLSSYSYMPCFARTSASVTKGSLLDRHCFVSCFFTFKVVPV